MFRQGCPRFINSLCVCDVPFLFLQLLPQRAHPASLSTNQRADPKHTKHCASKLRLIIWKYGILCLTVSWQSIGINQLCAMSGICMSCVSVPKAASLKTLNHSLLWPWRVKSNPNVSAPRCKYTDLHRLHVVQIMYWHTFLPYTCCRATPALTGVMFLSSIHSVLVSIRFWSNISVLHIDKD